MLDPASDYHTAFNALGSNLGDRAANIASALEQLRSTPDVTVARVSSLLENPAVGGPSDSPPFLNGAAELHTTLDAAGLLRRLHEIEHSLGRIRRQRWEPRLIDLDLLFFDQQIIDMDLPDGDGHLTIPHPRLHERLFVLQPLAEIGPKVMHPVLRVSIEELLARVVRKGS